MLGKLAQGKGSARIPKLLFLSYFTKSTFDSVLDSYEELEF